MSTNYNESSVSGTKWTRCHRMTFDNPLGGTPRVRFEEEEAFTVGAQTTSTPKLEMFVKPYDAAATIPLLNPETGIATGDTMTQAELYAVLYSLYIASATERDAA